MNLKLLIFSVLTILSLSDLSAQSKGRQIIIPSYKIDVLNSILNHERSWSGKKSTTLKSELISKNLISENDEWIKGLNDFINNNLQTQAITAENEKLESEFTSLKEENSRIKLNSNSSLNFDIVKPNSLIEIEMVFVEGGIFQMGSNDVDTDEFRPHKVKVNSFYIGKYEVTQSQWKLLMGNNPSYFSGCENCPVENVNWNDIDEFINKLNDQTGKDYRLPTEAQWEYAAKGGKIGRGYSYSGSNDLDAVAWYNENSERKTHSVGLKLGNELGIFDMTGNVWECCSNWYGSSGQIRVSRGGSVGHNAEDCLNSRRRNCYTGVGGISQGFRLVLPVSP
jgi:formylglycine-generating enzyme required for sulfatase activity